MLLAIAHQRNEASAHSNYTFYESSALHSQNHGGTSGLFSSTLFIHAHWVTYTVTRFPVTNMMPVDRYRRPVRWLFSAVPSVVGYTILHIDLA